jgi:hypothetical protein
MLQQSGDECLAFSFELEAIAIQFETIEMPRAPKGNGQSPACIFLRDRLLPGREVFTCLQSPRLRRGAVSFREAILVRRGRREKPHPASEIVAAPACETSPFEVGRARLIPTSVWKVGPLSDTATVIRVGYLERGGERSTQAFYFVARSGRSLPRPCKLGVARSGKPRADENSSARAVRASCRASDRARARR